MMKSVLQMSARRGGLLRNSLLLFFTLCLGSTAAAEVEVGTPAPGFSAETIEGESLSLDSLKGKYVVLEWFNYGCPFVRKHYRGADMQGLQKEFKEKDVVWLTINSTEKSHQDYRDAAKTQELVEELNIESSHFILDSDGSIGKAYGAKTTPHMYVINPEGVLVYRGAIDSDSDVDADPKEATNYVRTALTEVMEGKVIKVSDTKPYGCSVKYAS